MQKKLSSIMKKITTWIKKNKVIDVILFGSYVRSKSKPRDIDLCIIIKDEDEKKTLDLVDSLAQITKNPLIKFQINILSSSAFIKGDTLAKTLINEGQSISKKIKLSEILGFKANSLFVYTLKHFSSSKRVKFHYLLKGRYGAKGILKEVSGNFLGTGSIIIPIEKEDLLKEIFDKWDVEYKVQRMLLS